MNDRAGLRMFGMLLSATVHRWLGGAGIPRRLHVPALVAGIVAVDAVSAYFTYELQASLRPLAGFLSESPFRQTVLEYVLLALSSSATLLVVFGESSASQATQVVAMLRPLPVSRAFLAVARSLPPALALLVIAVSALPPAVAVIVALGWSDVPRVVAAVGASIASGAAIGLAAVAVLRAVRAGNGRGLPATTRYPIAVCAWAALGALQVWWLQATGASPAPLAWALVWPAAALSLAGVSAGAAIAAALLAAAYLVLAATAYVAAPEPEIAVLLRRVRLPWKARGRSAAFRLELLRLWRTGRMRSVAAVNAILGLLGAVAAATLPPDQRHAFALLIVLTLAVLWMAIPLMARGVGAWHEPLQLQLGASPARWALTLTAASWTFAAAVAAPGLVLLAVVEGDAQVGVAGAFLTIAGFGIASLIGFTIPAGGENTVGEVSGMVLGGLSLLAAVWIAGQVVHSTTAAAVAIGLVAVALAPLTGVIESARWRVDTGASRA